MAAAAEVKQTAASAAPPLSSLQDIDRFLALANSNGDHIWRETLCAQLVTSIPPKDGEAGWICDSDRVLLPIRTLSEEFVKGLWELCVPSVSELQAARETKLVLRQRLRSLIPPRAASHSRTARDERSMLVPSAFMLLSESRADGKGAAKRDPDTEHLVHVDFGTWHVQHLLHWSRGELQLADNSFVSAPNGFASHFELASVASLPSSFYERQTRFPHRVLAVNTNSSQVSQPFRCPNVAHTPSC